MLFLSPFLHPTRPSISPPAPTVPQTHQTQAWVKVWQRACSLGLVPSGTIRESLSLAHGGFCSSSSHMLTLTTRSFQKAYSPDSGIPRTHAPGFCFHK